MRFTVRIAVLQLYFKILDWLRFRNGCYVTIFGFSCKDYAMVYKNARQFKLIVLIFGFFFKFFFFTFY